MAEEKKKVTFFELDKYTLFAPVEGGKKASLTFSERDKYPRLTVFTRVESDNNGKGFITAPLDIDHFIMLLNALERIARAPAVDVKEKITVKHWPRDQSTNKINGELTVTSEIWYGKNTEGVVWISIVAPNRPKIVFEITLSEYHEFYNSKGERFTKGEGSAIRTIAMTNVLRTKFIEHCLTFRDTSIPRENKGPYSQRQQNDNTNTNTAFSSFDDDYIN